jgi:hypothetical protein
MSHPNADELEAQRQILGRLAPPAALASQTDALYENATEALLDHPKADPATKVGLILLARLSCDMRVCRMASSAGYCLQAMGLAASMMEILGTQGARRTSSSVLLDKWLAPFGTDLCVAVRET